MIRVGLLGCGTIGRILSAHAKKFTIVSVFDKVPCLTEEIATETGAEAHHDFESFIRSEIDLVVEAASIEAVQTYACRILSHKKDLVLMSVGALADREFKGLLEKTAKENGKIIHIPSGALFGLDNMRIGRISPFSQIILRTTKNRSALGLSPGEREKIFSGTAREAIRKFPRSLNISVAMSLAANQDVEVELWGDSDVKTNLHELFLEGEFGEAYIRVKNRPSPENPATSYLAALSLLSLIEEIDSPIRYGS